MPITSRSEPRKKGSPRWFLVFWLVLIAFRVWQVNHVVAYVLGGVALLLLLTGFKRPEHPFGGGTVPTPMPMPGTGSGSGSLPAPTRAPNFETITMPATPPDARPIEPDVGGATGKVIVLALVFFALGILAWLIFGKRLG